ncbi:MAG: hypothetical protein C4315_04460 [Chloroflexota bacterium]
MNRWSIILGSTLGLLLFGALLGGQSRADIRTQDLIATLTPVQDTTIFSGSPNSNRGGSDATDLWVGDGGPFGEERVLIQFSLSTVPVSVTIQQALLQLTLDQVATGYSPQPLSISIHRVTQSWAEATTWSQMANNFAESYATVTVGDTSACAFDITRLVRAWRAYDAGQGGFQNFGLMVKATAFVPGIQKIFFSREAKTQGVPGAQPPTLQIFSGPPAPLPPSPPVLPNRLFLPLVSQAATCP